MPEHRTEEEARKLWCPERAQSESLRAIAWQIKGYNDRGIALEIESMRCIASKCARWEWAPKAAFQRGEMPPAYRRGYCSINCGGRHG